MPRLTKIKEINNRHVSKLKAASIREKETFNTYTLAASASKMRCEKYLPRKFLAIATLMLFLIQ